jgi:glycerate dehydrogenase
MSFDCPLYNVPNITVTPHIAWAPLDTRSRLLDIVISNLEAFIAGTPKNKVN